MILSHWPPPPPTRRRSVGWWRDTAALDRLDALVQGGLGVAGPDGHPGLGQHRPGIHLQGGDVDGGPGLLGPGGQSVSHGVPPGEGRQQGGVGVEDATGVGIVDGLAEHGPEAGHDHHVDGVLEEGGGDGGRVAGAIERGPESAELGPVDEQGGHTGGGADLQGAAGPVGGHQPDRQAGVQDGLEDGPAARGQHPDGHRGRVGSVGGRRRNRGVSGCAWAHGRTLLQRHPRPTRGSEGHRTRATWPHRPASGAGLRRSVPPAQGVPLVPGTSASGSGNSEAKDVSGEPADPSPGTIGGPATPAGRRSGLRRRPAARAARRRRTPTGASRGWTARGRPPPASWPPWPRWPR